MDNEFGFVIEEATRSQAKLRIGLAAPSGAGKTMSALKLAYGITGDWGKIGVVDTEQGSASLYSHLGKFKVIKLEAPFTPERYRAALQAFEKAGMEVVILDSITHVWNGKGGLLEYNNSLGGKFQDWAKTTPRYQAFVEAILQSKCHVITTIRKKESYALSTENGKTTVQKQGMDDEIRNGFSYELTLSFDINMSHLAEASKDRTSLFMKSDGSNVGFVINEETGKLLKQWAETGEAVEEVEVPTPHTISPKDDVRGATPLPKKEMTSGEVDKFIDMIEQITDAENARDLYKQIRAEYEDSDNKERILETLSAKGKSLAPEKKAPATKKIAAA